MMMKNQHVRYLKFVVHLDDALLSVVLVECVHHVAHHIFLGHGSINIADDNLGCDVQQVTRGYSRDVPE